MQIYAVYLDEFGHIGPFINRNHEKFNHSPVFGLAGYIIPVEKVRNFGTWVFQQKLNMFESDFVGKNPTYWEKKGSKIYTPKSIEKYQAIRKFTKRLLKKINKMGGYVFYVGTEKPPGEIDSKQLYLKTLEEAIKRLDQFCEEDCDGFAKFFLMLDEHPWREEIITDASSEMYGKPRRNLIEPPFQLESHRYQTMQAADWIAALVGGISVSWKGAKNEYSDYQIFRKYFGSRLKNTQTPRSGVRDWIDQGPNEISIVTRTMKRISESCIGSNGDTWEFYKNSKGEWFWRRTAKNGEIVGKSHEGYMNKSDCIENAKRPGMDCNPSQSL